MNQVFNPPPAWQHSNRFNLGNQTAKGATNDSNSAQGINITQLPKNSELPSGWQLYPEADSAYFSSYEEDIREAILAPELIPATAPIAKRSSSYPLLAVLPGKFEANSTYTGQSSSDASDAPTGSKGMRSIIRSFATWWDRHFNLIGTILGFLAVVATIILFSWLYNFALTALPQSEVVVGGASISLELPISPLEL